MNRALLRVGIFAFSFAAGIGWAQPPRSTVTDLLTPDEFRRSGLTKLSKDELQNLNSALLRIVAQLTSSTSAISHNDNDQDLFDSSGRAVAYISDDDDQTIYLWSGQPVAYLAEGSVFGFNGKHLGWFEKGAVYDHDGGIVAAIKSRFATAVTAPGFKAFKEFKPFKGFKEFKPFKPFLSTTWSDTPARVFLLAGQ